MKRLRLAWLAALLAASLACQVIPTPPALQPTAINWLTPQANATALQAPVATATIESAGLAGEEPAPGDVQPFPTPALGEFAGVEIPVWEMAPVLGDYSLPVDWNQVANPDVTNGLTNSQRGFLARNGFVAIHSQEAQFASLRQEVAAQNGQPFYLTTDAAYHALNQALGELTLALESEELRPRLRNLLGATLDEVVTYLPDTQGTSIEGDTWKATATLAVALRLLDSEAALPPGIEAQVDAQVAQILKGGQGEASIFPGWMEDFDAYLPVGHYAGSPELESYFRALTWLSRVSFPLDNRASGPAPSRAPLVLTLALREAKTEHGPAVDEWAAIDGVLAFMIGPALDVGPRETARLMDEIYGPGVTLLDLADDALWKDFLSFVQALPPPKNSSEFLKGAGAPPQEHNWRLLGDRFHLDETILTALIYEQVGAPDKRRELASGLDMMSVLGSAAAMQAGEQAGFSAYLNYPTQLKRLQSAAQAQSRQQWLNTVLGAWSYAFQPQLGVKGEAFPTYMRTPAWGYKDLNSALGSWAELRRDAAYYPLPQAETLPAPRSITSGPAPAYVEPNPPVFFRLAALAGTTSAGLKRRGMTGWRPAEAGSLSAALIELDDLGQQFKWLGAIAARELQGLPLTKEETWLIQSPLGPAEQRAYQFQNSSLAQAPWQSLPAMPVISSLPGKGERVQQVGVGLVDRLFVIIPMGDRLWVAQGGVYSYYEFAQESQARLKDDVWQRLLESTSPALPPWMENFIFLDGYPFGVLAFRIGDVYRVTPSGAGLNARSEPALGGEILRQLEPGNLVILIDGPVQADGLVWWKFNLDPNGATLLEGWMVESQEFYERVAN